MRSAILAGVSDASTLRDLINRYDAAWNDHDLDTILALHAPGMVFENHTAAERAEGDEVGPHIAEIFENWPDLSFRGRRQLVRDDLVVSEWTASATDRDGRRLEWDGVDIFSFEDGLISRKDVYSAAHRARVLGD
jgi:ketosteroid isomerase-like protein